MLMKKYKNLNKGWKIELKEISFNNNQAQKKI